MQIIRTCCFYCGDIALKIGKIGGEERGSDFYGLIHDRDCGLRINEDFLS